MATPGVRAATQHRFAAVAMDTEIHIELISDLPREAVDLDLPRAIARPAAEALLRAEHVSALLVTPTGAVHQVKL